MDSDIAFGELEELPRDKRLRPDQNRHYAVVPYQLPGETDLPIYVDVDVMRDLEAHAQSNLEAELGGVLLGGQYEDDAGRPFVVISDSLRAEHYEHSKGSFKFTHETWSDISRKRDEFPADLQMVGWYHTHPGWGIFLSGMDTFICRHFFNKPLDVALVIDPCKQERAFFQWTTAGSPQTRLTRGFHLTGSRFRLPELEIYAAQLEGKLPMPTDPRYSGIAGGYPPTVVQVGEARQTWLAVAVLGLLSMQFLVLALIAWRMLVPPPAAGTQPAAPPLAAAELAAQRELLDRVIGQLDVAPAGLVDELEQQRQRNEELQSSNLGLLAQVREVNKSQQVAEKRAQTLTSKNEQLSSTIERMREERRVARGELDQLKDKLAQYEQPAGEEGTDSGGGVTGWLVRWKWYVGGGLVLLVLAVAVALVAYYRPLEDTDEDDQAPAARPPES